jgi:hypothetical protein
MGIGLLVLLTACQSAGEPLNAAMHGPGDAINGLRLETGTQGAPPLWAFCSTSPDGSHIKSFDCRTPILPTLAIGNVFLLADEAFANLNWSDLAWELSIDGQPVDLEQFGTFEYVMPGMSKGPSPIREVFMRVIAWNIMLTNLNPGEHTLRFLAQSETDSYAWLVNLVIEGTGGVDISSVPFDLKS